MEQKIEETNQKELKLYHPMIIPAVIGVMIVVGIVVGILISIRMEKPIVQPQPQVQQLAPTPTIEFAPENTEL